MAINSSRWLTITPSHFPWEREALDYVRERLPDHEPIRAWSNFELLTAEGQVYEVDLLVLTKVGFWLVEIKGRPGVVSGDSGSWTWTDPGGRRITVDNPYLLANRKAKALASLLRVQPVARKLKIPFPFLDAVVFLSHEAVESRLQGAAASHVFLRDRGPEDSGGARPGLLAALLRREGGGLAPMPRTAIDAPVARAISRALEEAGVRPSRKSRRVGDYLLGELIVEGPGFQDFAAEHVSLKGVHVRVRRYLVSNASSEEERKQLRRAAERELRVLHGLDHPGILQALNLIDDELGPALILKHDPRFIRLDHYLAALDREGKSLTVDQRLAILRQTADAVRYAHTRRVIHRALGPASVLITDPAADRPEVKLFNWQVSVREERADSSRMTNVEGLVETGAHVYMAPEAFASRAELTPAADVFSLGALAYLLFAGKPPATSRAALNDALREHGGLKIASLVDGAGPALDALIYDSTCPEVDQRTSNAEDFLSLLDEVEDELTRPEPRRTVDPLQAKKGDALEHGWTVKRVLGKGSTALALLVSKADEPERVLKVALESADNARLAEEAKALRTLHSEYIVALEGELAFGARRALVLRMAGELTLAAYLAKEGRLSLDLLERFGENLLEAVKSLEGSGVLHRDLKPENIGVSSPHKQRYQLVLFDFSLAGAPLESIQLGTPQYRDPFLELRKPPRWDPAADRYSAAVVLFEMATGPGSYPRWGDGRSDPAVTKEPLVLDPNQFEASVRDGFTQFFEKAFAREVARRFGDALEMKKAWLEVFHRAAAPRVPAAEPEPEAPPRFDLEGAKADTPVAAIGLSTRAVNALDRIDVLTLRDLTCLSLGKVQVLRGVGRKTRSEIRSAVSQAREQFPSLLLTPPSPAEAEPLPSPASVACSPVAGLPDFDTATVEDLCQRFLGPRPGGRGEKTWLLAAAFLGLEDPRPEPGEWPAQSQVARERGVAQAQVSVALSRLRARWREKDPWMTRLREEVLAQIIAAAGVLTARELAEALLAPRAAGLAADRRALEMASAAARAAVEAEQGVERPRFILARETVRGGGPDAPRVFVALAAPLAAWAARLGALADEIAAADPLPSPVRAVARLREVPVPDMTISDPTGPGAVRASAILAAPPGDERLLRLAAAASRTAAVSPRGELYPRGLAAARALVLARGAVSGLGLGEPGSRHGGDTFRPEDVDKRIRSRYPESASLPPRPELDHLLEGLGLELTWDESSGSYRRKQHEPLPTQGSSIVDPRIAGKTSRRPSPGSAEAALVRDFEERLRRALRSGGFLVLRASPSQALACERQLDLRLPNQLERLSCDRLLLEALRAAARDAGVEWDVVLEADRAGPGSADWPNLLQLVTAAVIEVEREVLTRAAPALLVHLGLLRRYGQIGLLERLRDQAGRRGVCPAVWALNLDDEQSDLPRLDGEEIPLTSPGEQVRVPAEWFQDPRRTEREEAVTA